MALDCDEFDMIRIQIGNFITDSQIYRGIYLQHPLIPIMHKGKNGTCNITPI